MLPWVRVMFGKNLGGQFLDIVSGFPENRYKALEESRKLLGLTAEEYRCFLKALCKSEYSDVNFNFGNLSITFDTYFEELSLTFHLKKKGFERSAEYKFKPSDLGLPKKQKKLEDFGDE